MSPKRTHDLTKSDWRRIMSFEPPPSAEVMDLLELLFRYNNAPIKMSEIARNCLPNESSDGGARKATLNLIRLVVEYFRANGLPYRLITELLTEQAPDPVYKICRLEEP